MSEYPEWRKNGSMPKHIDGATRQNSAESSIQTAAVLVPKNRRAWVGDRADLLNDCVYLYVSTQ
jgi:hypothetical protein